MAGKAYINEGTAYVLHGETPQVCVVTSFSEHAIGLVGKKLRVAVTEVVDECCEKWRGRPGMKLTVGSDTAVWTTVAMFCPECGKPL
jgi:hypothetical protein